MYKMEVLLHTDPGCPLKIGKDVTSWSFGYASWLHD